MYVWEMLLDSNRTNAYIKYIKENVKDKVGVAMQIGDLVKVRGQFVEEYALIVDIGETRGSQWVKVMYFDREEELVHPTQVRRV